MKRQIPDSFVSNTARNFSKYLTNVYWNNKQILKIKLAKKNLSNLGYKIQDTLKIRINWQDLLQESYFTAYRDNKFISFKEH